MGWCRPDSSFTLLCNDRGEIITFCLTGANVDDRDPRVWRRNWPKTSVWKVFAQSDYISPNCLIPDLIIRHPAGTWN
ncbi:MAG: hypothetical protein ACLTOV_08795 [Phocaeicola sp.]